MKIDRAIILAAGLKGEILDELNSPESPEQAVALDGLYDEAVELIDALEAILHRPRRKRRPKR